MGKYARLVPLLLALPGCIPFQAKAASREEISMVRRGLETWFSNNDWQPKGWQFKGGPLWIVGPLAPVPMSFHHRGVRVFVVPNATPAELRRLRDRACVVRLRGVRVGPKNARIDYSVWYPGEHEAVSVGHIFAWRDGRWQPHMTFAVQ